MSAQNKSFYFEQALVSNLKLTIRPLFGFPQDCSDNDFNHKVTCHIPVNVLFPCRFWCALKFAAVVYVLLHPPISHLNGF